MLQLHQVKNETQLYETTIAERLQQLIVPTVPYTDILYDKTFFYDLAAKHPQAIEQANSILGFKQKNFLKNWFEKEYVFQVFDDMTEEDKTKMQVMIMQLIKSYKQVVLSKEIYHNIELLFNKQYNKYVLKATFDRIFYSPRVKELMKKLNLQLSNKSLIFQQTVAESKAPRYIPVLTTDELINNYKKQILPSQLNEPQINPGQMDKTNKSLDQTFNQDVVKQLNDFYDRQQEHLRQLDKKK